MGGRSAAARHGAPSPPRKQPGPRQPHCGAYRSPHASSHVCFMLRTALRCLQVVSRPGLGCSKLLTAAPHPPPPPPPPPPPALPPLQDLTIDLCSKLLPAEQAEATVAKLNRKKGKDWPKVRVRRPLRAGWLGVRRRGGGGAGVPAGGVGHPPCCRGTAAFPARHSRQQGPGCQHMAPGRCWTVPFWGMQWCTLPAWAGQLNRRANV